MKAMKTSRRLTTIAAPTKSPKKSPPAVPWLRAHSYHLFKNYHLSVSIFVVVCCALHDLPILFFAVPVLADWYVGWQSTRLATLAAEGTVRLLAETSGPWVELSIDNT